MTAPAPFYADPAVTIWHGDARALPLEASSVDLIVTSPPYYSLRSYEDGGEHYDGQIGDEPTPEAYLDALVEVTRECVRVLKPRGSMFVVLGDKFAERAGPARAGGADDDPTVSRPATRPPRGRRSVPVKSMMLLPQRYAIRCVDELGLICRNDIVWSKTNPMPESVTDRARRSHELVWHFTRRPTYYAGLDAVREPHTMRPQRRPSGRAVDDTPRQGQPRQSWSTAARDEPGVDGHPLGKIPGTVWEIATQPLVVPPELEVDHHAAYPLELPRRIIRGWCPPGGVVLDPFGGTGTTGLVARAEGRIAHLVDRSADYCRLARWRVTDPAELARALEVPKPPPPPAGVDALFDLTPPDPTERTA